MALNIHSYSSRWFKSVCLVVLVISIMSLVDLVEDNEVMYQPARCYCGAVIDEGQCLFCDDYVFLSESFKFERPAMKPFATRRKPRWILHIVQSKRKIYLKKECGKPRYILKIKK